MTSNPHASRRIGNIFLLLALALLGHGVLSLGNLRGASLPGTLPPLVAPLLLWVGIAFALVGVAYRRGSPAIFQKRANGTLQPFRRLLLLPYHVVTLGGLWAQRLTSWFPLFHQVAPGLYLGGAPSVNDARRLQTEGVNATLDLTSEFEEVPALREADYRCIPLLDATAPTPEELADGVEWIHAQRQAGKTVYVHCAKGVGRSATFAAAYLLRSGQAQTPDEAVRLLQKTRTRVHLTGAQAASLAEYAREKSPLHIPVRGRDR